MAFSGFHFVFGAVGSLAGSLPEGSAQLMRNSGAVAQTVTAAGATSITATSANTSDFGDPCCSITATTPGWYAFAQTAAAASAAAGSTTGQRWYHPGDGSEHNRFVRPGDYAAWVAA